MGFIKDKFFLWGILAGLFWTGFGLVVLIFFLSDDNIENSLQFLYGQNRLGGVISLAALINLPVFFLALKKNKFSFAAGIVAISIATVLLIFFLKINT
ncbi:MAG: hypothetical protein ACKVJR_01180 [Flavobacteriales bacterium]|jgi:hypothetical protein|nr:hypothetical protein [Flavobacteriaceae bacterium]|tara:strand:+ start:209 stop:502 length:294 start_codon:yes stop_codon:yes gene_type:complete